MPPPTDFIVGLGRRSDMICATQLPESARSRLSPEELAILRRVGAGARIGDVIEKAQLSEAVAITLLVGLRMKGMVSLLAAGSRVDSSSPELSEDVDLEPARKREVLDLEVRIGTDDFFKLLGVTPAATADEVKRAYFEASKKFHPDRYYGKKLGTFAGRIDRIFQKLSEAFATLSDPEKRKVYVMAHPELRALEGEDPLRVQERRNRLARHPYLARHSRIHELLDRGAATMEKDPAKAIADLSLAVQYAPGDKRAGELLAEARRRLDALKANDLFDEALRVQTLQDAASAADLYRKAAQLDPKNAQFADKAAKALLAQGGEAAATEARTFAQRAVSLKPKVADYHITYGSALSILGSKALAMREFETALELDPSNAFAKSQMKKSRWPF
jgi:tetratricopeptide (TPR) repeat protein